MIGIKLMLLGLAFVIAGTEIDIGCMLVGLIPILIGLFIKDKK